ncbi:MULTISPECIES: DUF1294 domain-containing protein [Shewanella]|uniref:DUF1294 domain-containing protein n=1 Tax=Shewanella marisflavi TaxID=260364 RepID=A0ABX5WRQ8_9GAMM|nr:MULTISPECIES: DUF1294 domain-containing protein [Shewanella]QDF76270.1 DUF1294 domain-containing protein [Shewanella marisflavi]
MRKHRPNNPKQHQKLDEHRAKPSATKSNGNKRKQKKTRWTLGAKLRLFLIIGLFIGLLLAEQQHLLPIGVFIYYAIMSLLTFICYALDKRAAQQDRWRIRESRLHWLSLLGGWPGAMLAQQQLRHKSSKRSFRLMLWLMVLINLGLLFAILSPQGQALISFN